MPCGAITIKTTSLNASLIGEVLAKVEASNFFLRILVVDTDKTVVHLTETLMALFGFVDCCYKNNLLHTRVYESNVYKQSLVITAITGISCTIIA